MDHSPAAPYPGATGAGAPMIKKRAAPAPKFPSRPRQPARGGGDRADEARRALRALRVLRASQRRLPVVRRSGEERPEECKAADAPRGAAAKPRRLRQVGLARPPPPCRQAPVPTRRKEFVLPVKKPIQCCSMHKIKTRQNP